MFFDIQPSYPPMSNQPSSCTNYTMYPIKKTNLHLLAVSTLSSCAIGSQTVANCSKMSNCASCVKDSTVNSTCQVRSLMRSTVLIENTNID